MEQTYNILVTGFKTKEQAEVFMQWFSGAGEQDSSEWLGIHGNYRAITNGEATFHPEIKWQDNTALLVLNVQELNNETE